MHRAVVVRETAGPLIVSQNFYLFRPRSHDHGLVLLALLHHRVMGEQLWALTTGTMKRAVAAGKLPALLVPELPLDALSALVTLVEQLLQAQMTVAFPGRRIPLRLYWMDGSAVSVGAARP